MSATLGLRGDDERGRMVGFDRPLVIGHRGAPAWYPEHTEPSYRAAMAAGADAIEVDVHATADGVLVARHDPALAGTTDVADRADLRHLLRVRSGESGGSPDWWIEELSAAQVLELRARERWPATRPWCAAYDGRFPVLTLGNVLTAARRQARRSGRSIGVAVEVKDVARAMARGVDVVGAALGELARAGMPSPNHPAWVMAFEAEPLRRLHRERVAGRLPDLRLVRLVEDRVPDEPEWDDIGSDVDVVGVSIALVLSSAGADQPGSMMSRAADRGLDVWGWTFRAENAFLPESLRRGSDLRARGDVAAQVDEALAIGLSGLVCDQPDVVTRVRQ